MGWENAFEGERYTNHGFCFDIFRSLHFVLCKTFCRADKRFKDVSWHFTSPPASGCYHFLYLYFMDWRINDEILDLLGYCS